MPTLSIKIADISLVSRWTATSKPQGQGVFDVVYSTPTKAVVTKYVDTTGMLAGSTINSATLAGNTTYPYSGGYAHATIGGTEQWLNGSPFSKPFTSVMKRGNVPIVFSFKANGRKGTPPNGGKSNHSGSVRLTNLVLTINYTLPFTKVSTKNVAVAKDMASPAEVVRLSWEGVAGTNNALTGYKVFRGTTLSNFALLANVSGTFLDVTAPTPNGTYYYKVQALGSVAGYDGELSGAVSITVVTTAPKPPTNIMVDGSAEPNTEHVLSWSGAEGGTNNPIDGYRVYRAIGEGDFSFLVETAEEECAVVSMNDNGGVYRYKVLSKGRYFDGVMSDVYASLRTVYTLTDDFTLDSTAIVAGEEITGHVSNGSHLAKFIIGEHVQELGDIAEDFSLELPLSLLVHMTDAVEEICVFRVHTAGGSYVDKAVSLVAGNDIVPTISGGSVSFQSLAEYTAPLSPVPPVWGYMSGLCKGVCSLADVVASGAYGSTIVGYEVECLGHFARILQNEIWTTPLLTAGNVPVVFRAIDSRGRKGEEVLTLSVGEYALPYFVGMRIFRCGVDGVENDEGTFAKLQGNIIFANEENRVAMALEYREQGDAGTWTAISDGLAVFGGSFDLGKSYDLRITLTDSLGGVRKYLVVLAKSNYAMHFCDVGGKQGVAFGKVATVAETVDFGTWAVKMGNAVMSQELFQAMVAFFEDRQ